MPKIAPDERLISEEVLTGNRKAFESSTMARVLASQNLQEIEHIPGSITGRTRLFGLQSRYWNDSADRNLTIMGKELLQKKSPSAWQTWRQTGTRYKKYLQWEEDNGLTGRVFWQKKEQKAWAQSRAAWDSTGASETINRYLTHKDIPDVGQLRENILNVLDRWDKTYNDVVVGPFSDKKWTSQMNWNRNSGWPYHMPISEERFTSVDLPNWYGWYARWVNCSDDEVETLIDGKVPNFSNINRNIYMMIGRPEDRIIWAIELLFKAPGAFFNYYTTRAVRDDRVAWNSTMQMHEEMSEALNFADAIIAADDIKKYDSNFERPLMDLVYQTVKESNHLRQHPELRAVLLGLLYLFTKDAWLHMSPDHRVKIQKGLPSGHPLTQWIGSLVHLALYDRWSDKFSLDYAYQQVLSDDGIQVLRGMTLKEVDDLVYGPMAEDAELFGFTFHPEKTIVAEPGEPRVVGYRTDLERPVEMYNSTFFLKQFANADLGGAHGNEFGAVASLIDMERGLKEDYGAEIRPYILGRDISLGDNEASQGEAQILDLVRCADIISSVGPGAPMYDTLIDHVQQAWPGFSTRGRKILTEKLDRSLFETTTRYAGRTLDSGIVRMQVINDLLAEEREPLWVNLAWN